MTIDAHTIVATVDGVPVRVLNAQTTLDRGWAPYAQGRLTLIASAFFSLLDPTRRARINITHSRRYSDSKTVAEVSALHAPKTVAQASTQHAGQTVEQMSALYRTVWNPDGPHGSGGYITVTGWVTKARRSRTDPEAWDVLWCGDEQRAITRLSWQRSWRPGANTVRNIVQAALAKAGLDPSLGGTGDAAVPADDDGTMPPWPAGQSCWDYLDPIVSAADMRLYADETGAWILTADTAPTGVTVLGPEAVEVTDDWDTENGRFFDHAVIVYEWETLAGAAKTDVDYFSAGQLAGYTETVQGRKTRPGRAERIVKKAMKRALAQDWETVADYNARPGHTATITPDASTGIIDSITWTYPDARARVTVTDVTNI